MISLIIYLPSYKSFLEQSYHHTKLNAIELFNAQSCSFVVLCVIFCLVVPRASPKGMTYQFDLYWFLSGMTMLSVLSIKTPHFDRLATRATFFCSGFATAAWASIIPFVKLNVQISDGTMGLMLLCLGGGALAGMPVSGIFTSRFGCKKVLIGSVLAIAVLFPFLILASTPLALAITLLMFGTSVGTTGCAMNIHALAVEKDANRPLMSGFHGFYSLGGMSGAFVLTLLLTTGVTAVTASFITSVLIITLLLMSAPSYKSAAIAQTGPMFAVPEGVVFTIGVVCFFFFLAEGTVLDWSGIFLSEYRSVPTSSAGMGILFFSISMTTGRLLGDRVVAALGGKKVFTYGTLIALFGFIISLSVPYWQIALFGYMLVGIGCSNIVPVMYSAAGKQTVMPEALAITAISTMGYIGVLSGPAIVGFGAEVVGLPMALYLVVMLVATALFLGKKVKL